MLHFIPDNQQPLNEHNPKPSSDNRFLFASLSLSKNYLSIEVQQRGVFLFNNLGAPPPVRFLGESR